MAPSPSLSSRAMRSRSAPSGVYDGLPSRPRSEREPRKEGRRDCRARARARALIHSSSSTTLPACLPAGRRCREELRRSRTSRQGLPPLVVPMSTEFPAAQYARTLITTTTRTTTVVASFSCPFENFGIFISVLIYMLPLLSGTSSGNGDYLRMQLNH